MNQHENLPKSNAKRRRNHIQVTPGMTIHSTVVAKGLQSEESEKRRTFGALHESLRDTALKLWAECANSVEEETRRAALQFLYLVGDFSPPTVEVYLPLLTDKNRRVRDTAMFALQALPADRAIPEKFGPHLDDIVRWSSHRDLIRLAKILKKQVRAAPSVETLLSEDANVANPA